VRVSARADKFEAQDGQASVIDVAVLGAGPAGAAVALALTRLGHRVVVAAWPRGFSACEGISERVLAGLANAGFARALEDLPVPSPRAVSWNGSYHSANTERLLLRRDFDSALLRDLDAAGVEVRRVRGEVLHQGADDVELGLRDSSGRRSVLRARLVVDARGRAAPRAAGARVRGPETVSLLQRWEGPPAGPESAVTSFHDGWAWFARTAVGETFTQITLSADDRAIPKRSGLRRYFFRRLAGLPESRAFVEGHNAVGVLAARACTPILQAPLLDGRVLRVGDAAMAVDPLSGNGIFQALSSASVAPAVINTLLRDPGQSELAIRFYSERVQHIFYRFARIGRDFYRGETRWPEESFWRERGAWPDDEPSHDKRTPHLHEIADRPVVENGFIRQRQVVLTSDQPLGVWRVAGVEIAPLLGQLPVEGDAGATALRRRIAAECAENPAAESAILDWLRRHGISV